VTHFLLLHGAWHGAWCWERLVPELEALGHGATAVDLPFDDGKATFDDATHIAVDAVPAVDDLVVVGHSLGAMVAPLVAARVPVSSWVLLCPVIPNLNGMPWDDAPNPNRGDIYLTETNPDGSTRWPTLELATRAFYADCSPEDAAWAYERLRTMNARSLWDRPYPLTEWPAGRRVVIASPDDAAITIEFVRHVSPERLGIEAIEIAGDHSPFLARPAELARLLHEVAV
jgi:pimeloyl-ACP methyl ester carboxylesterase